ncbi:unnamed protein product [Euphydryas editha]|uniref:Putative nuclease HARBI1 n=1 Tax=Euphydryas editha TaxID=104508 RepID=A0AAU9UCW0_EUPED|nr:unnamed protein product [Euphydryas editha]
MNDLEDFVEFVNYARRFRETGPRRYLRDYSNPFTKYSVSEFYARYRFTPHTVKNIILPMLEPDLSHRTKRGLPFAPEVMILLTLRYFATGTFQKLEGDVMDICQQSVSRIVAKVSTLLARKMKDFVKFPTTHNDVNKVKQAFYDIAEFPGVIGCIDCTHIKIRSPGGISSEVYRNRKGWFSINVQVVTGPNLEFYDVVARWPGSTHDSFIYNSSSVKQRLNTGTIQGLLLGDSGYAISNVLLTPFLSPNSNGHEQYNKSHIKTRNTVERAFGVWKRRFPCLQVGMGIKLKTVVAVICACATLHNLSIKIDDLLNITDDDDDDLSAGITNESNIQEDPNSNGFLFRQSLVERFFNNNN